MFTSSRIPHSVFAPHAAKDFAFAELLLKVLGMHGIHAWHDPDDVLKSDGTPGVLDKGLRETESMVVVLSQAALQSDVLREQVRAFAPNTPNGHVYVLVMEAIEPDHALLHDLEGSTRIDCTISRLEGMRKLAAAMALNEAATQPKLLPRFLSQLDKLSQINPLIQPKRPLPAAMRQQLLMEIIDSFHSPLDRKFSLVNPDDGEVMQLPAGVLEELVLDSQGDSDGLLAWVPEFFVRAVAEQLGEAFRVEPLHRERVRTASAKSSTTLAPPPSVQPAQVAALRKFNTLASNIKATPVAV